jgi:diaminohydroxyphosphoribosylaminopyrimidine deaminase/5-amino-6-(5-phosphoribosylamino)uracil reductase
MIDNKQYIERCIQLAQLGHGKVSPNPMVGAVIVHENRIIGEGYHTSFGMAHAEVEAVNAVQKAFPSSWAEMLKSSTIYVSLEPCVHHGKTPPCADLIISHQIPKVIIGSLDPFDQVNGKGIQKLKDAGIEVIVDLEKQACDHLNRRFFTYHQKNRPYIILKWAQTSSGFFAPADKKQFWITGKEAKILNHQWRTEEDSILVGTQTVLIDNPSLTARLISGKNPTRIVIDEKLEIPESANIYKGEDKVIVFTSEDKAPSGNKYFPKINFEHYPIQEMMYNLYLNEIQSVIIEGGAFTINQFIKYGLWDEARVFTGADNIPEGIDAPKLNCAPTSKEKVGDDTLTMYFKK